MTIISEDGGVDQKKTEINKLSGWLSVSEINGKFIFVYLFIYLFIYFYYYYEFCFYRVPTFASQHVILSHETFFFAIPLWKPC